MDDKLDSEDVYHTLNLDDILIEEIDMTKYNTVTNLPNSGNYSINTSGMAGSGSWMTGAAGSTGATWPSSSNIWNSTITGITGSYGSSSLDVLGDANFDGNITWKGRNLGQLLSSIEDRLAILTEPDPEKLAKFAALKKAYDNYKLLEKLIGDDDGSNTTEQN